MSFKWCLKQKMAEKGIWRATDLTKLLNAYGIDISSSMVSRIVDKIPEKINTKVFFAICDILKCSPHEILIFEPTSIQIDVLSKVVGDDIGIKPGPKPKRKTNIQDDIPNYILGPKGGVIK